MGALFDQNTITKNYENEVFEDGRAEGRAEGSIASVVCLRKSYLN